MQNIKMKGPYHSFEGNTEVLLHRILFDYWDFGAELTDELKASLTEAAEERAKYGISEGWHGGELNYIYRGEEEIRGWWQIG